MLRALAALYRDASQLGIDRERKQVRRERAIGIARCRSEFRERLLGGCFVPLTAQSLQFR